MSRPSGPTNIFNMSGPSVVLFLAFGGLMFGGCAMAIAQAGDILAAFLLLPCMFWVAGKMIDAKAERDNRAELEPEPEPVTVERIIGTVYVCNVVHPDGRVQELAAETLPELQRLASRAIGTPTRLEIGR